MGAYYGWGYCLCTDRHFRVRRRLGYAVPESSFIQLLFWRAIRLRIGSGASNSLASWVFAAIVAATAITWAVQWRRQVIGMAVVEDRRRFKS